MFVRASERRWFENSKKGSKLFLDQKSKELEHFKISKISKKCLKVDHFSRFFRKCRELKNWTFRVWRPQLGLSQKFSKIFRFSKFFVNHAPSARGHPHL